MKRATSFRFGEDTLRLLEQLAEVKRISQRAVVEMLIRQEARREGLLPKPSPGGKKK
jgi:predicted transcriptional regulator